TPGWTPRCAGTLPDTTLMKDVLTSQFRFRREPGSRQVSRLRQSPRPNAGAVRAPLEGTRSPANRTRSRPENGDVPASVLESGAPKTLAWHAVCSVIITGEERREEASDVPILVCG